MRIKVIFRENFRERRAPCTLLLHPQNEGTFPFVWISSAVLRDGDPRRKLSFESLPRLCLSGAGTLNHSSICLGAKFFPKTPALSLICKLPRPGEGENVFCCIASRCRGRQPPDRSCSLCLAPQGSQTPVGAGGCRFLLRATLEAAGCDSPPSLAAFRASEPLLAPLGCRCRLRERLPPVLQCARALQTPSPGARSQFLPESHPLRLARPYLCHLWLLPAL